MGNEPSYENLDDMSGGGHLESLVPESLRMLRSGQPHADKSLRREHGDGQERSGSHTMGNCIELGAFVLILLAYIVPVCVHPTNPTHANPETEPNHSTSGRIGPLHASPTTPFARAWSLSSLESNKPKWIAGHY